VVSNNSGDDVSMHRRLSGVPAGRQASISTCRPLLRHNPLIFSLHEATQQVIGQHAQVRLPVLQLISRHYVGKVQVTCMTSSLVAVTTASAAAPYLITAASTTLIIVPRLSVCLSVPCSQLTNSVELWLVVTVEHQ